MKKIVNGIIIMLVVFMVFSVTAVSSVALESTTTDTKLSSNSKYSSYSYVLDSYDVNIVVNEDNTLNITETIGAYFNVSKHGIYRNIPIANRVKRADGTTFVKRVRITDLVVNNTFTSSVSNGYRSLQIGDEHNTVKGPQNYVIKYTYDLGKDISTDYDEFYFNLIGDEWESPIGNVTFTITMPKGFDAKKLGFSSGSSGTAGSSNVTYQVNGNVITGKYIGVLKPGEALTARLELPESYFVINDNGVDIILILAYILPISLMFICAYLWFKFGRDEKVIETVEFYPPEGLNSAEIGFVYKGNADYYDVNSLLVYLAGKGYIKIVEQKDKSIFSRSNSFILIRSKEYDGNNLNERLFLSGLFKEGRRLSISAYNEMFMIKDQPQPEDVDEDTYKVVTPDDLKDHFYVTLNKIVENLNSKEQNERVYERDSLINKLIAFFMISISYITIIIKPLIECFDTKSIIIYLFFPIFGMFLLTEASFGKKTKTGRKLIYLVTFIIIAFTFTTAILPSLLNSPSYITANILGLACIIVMFVLYKIMKKRTNYGAEMLDKIKGFKTFLETAEKPKLEELVMENPSYFYNILPYAYVLGVSDKWIKNFESITLQSPEWYYGYNAFNFVHFGSFINSTMSTANGTMASTPSSAVGSSGGGGFAGGGFGGGGGGGW